MTSPPLNSLSPPLQQQQQQQQHPRNNSAIFIGQQGLGLQHVNANIAHLPPLAQPQPPQPPLLNHNFNNSLQNHLHHQLHQMNQLLHQNSSNSSTHSNTSEIAAAEGFSPEDIHHLLGDVLGGAMMTMGGDAEVDDHETEDHEYEYTSHLSPRHPQQPVPLIQSMTSNCYEDHEDHQDNIDTTTCTSSMTAVMTVNRTERKRSREKQRRSDVNKQFQDLTALLRKLETDDPDEFSHLPPYSPANRVELMERTVQLLSVLYERNKKRKVEITTLSEKLELAQKAGEDTAAKLKEALMSPMQMGGNKVMMMVPMLIHSGGGVNGAASSGGEMNTPTSTNANASTGGETHHASNAASVAAAMPFQPWMNSFMGMPSIPEAQPMLSPMIMTGSSTGADAAGAGGQATAAMPMSFFMPIATSSSSLSSAHSAPSPSSNISTAAMMGSFMSFVPTTTTTTTPTTTPNAVDGGDLKQKAASLGGNSGSMTVTGSNLAHCA